MIFLTTEIVMIENASAITTKRMTTHPVLGIEGLSAAKCSIAMIKIHAAAKNIKKTIMRIITGLHILDINNIDISHPSCRGAA
ncbi:hypothetical protein FPJ27_14730 [Burkholderia sp. MS455]|uniref:hypothetical protein n=1 Tax=Burkholderia sp. MS455 TaxID=2811788 RepID=UPI00195D9EDC|nr:hypothetical protein [Burkholderia sp. MS455]QRR07555.1 hypothetical protein FPJ27_14730 [Burkholderia sp. MS455]